MLLSFTIWVNIPDPVTCIKVPFLSILYKSRWSASLSSTGLFGKLICLDTCLPVLFLDPLQEEAGKVSDKLGTPITLNPDLVGDTEKLSDCSHLSWKGQILKNCVQKICSYLLKLEVVLVSMIYESKKLTEPFLNKSHFKFYITNHVIHNTKLMSITWENPQIPRF